MRSSLMPVRPVLLRVGAAEVEGGQLAGSDELLADGLGMGQADEDGGRRVGQLRPGQAGAVHLGELLLVPDRPVTDQEALLAPGHQLRRQLLRPDHRGRGDPLHPARDRAVEGGEHLAASGVHRGGDQPVGQAGAVGQEVEADDPHHRDVEGRRDR